MISADECREAQALLGFALRAMMGDHTGGAQLDDEAKEAIAKLQELVEQNREKHRGSPVFWAIALALNAVARRPGGFEVAGFVVDAAAWFDWDEIFKWLEERGKHQGYVVQDDGGSVNAIVSGKSSRTYSLSALDNAGGAQRRRRGPLACCSPRRPLATRRGFRRGGRIRGLDRPPSKPASARRFAARRPARRRPPRRRRPRRRPSRRRGPRPRRGRRRLALSNARGAKRCCCCCCAPRAPARRRAPASD